MPSAQALVADYSRHHREGKKTRAALTINGWNNLAIYCMLHPTLNKRWWVVKILYLDTETAPTQGFFYGRYDISISPDQVINSGFFLSYQAAWNDGKVFVESLREKGKLTPSDDKELCERLSKLIGEADIVVAHNAVRFDLAKLSARLATHGLKPFPPPKVVDTLKACRRFFKFEANSLDSVCRELGIGKKFHSGGFETSLACMNGDKKAWDKLLKYGKHDVVLLRELYLRIRPWITNHPNANLYDEGAVSCCPNCSSYNIQWRGYSATATMRYARFQCKSCGAWGSDRKNNLDKEKRDSIVRGAR